MAVITVIKLDGSCVLGPENVSSEAKVCEVRERVLVALCPFELNETVQMRDEDDRAWDEGIVSNLLPLEVKCMGARRGRVWDRVRKCHQVKYVTLFFGARQLFDHESIGAVLAEERQAQWTAVVNVIKEDEQRVRLEAIEDLETQFRDYMSVPCHRGHLEETNYFLERQWMVEQLPAMFSTFSDADLSDTMLMMEAIVRLGPCVLEYVPESLKGNADFVLGIMQQNRKRAPFHRIMTSDSEILGFASNALKADVEFMTQVTDLDDRSACFTRSMQSIAVPKVSAMSHADFQRRLDAISDLESQARTRIMIDFGNFVETDEDLERQWMIEQLPAMFSTFSKTDLSDRLLMTEAAVRLGPGVLRHVHESLKDDADFVLTILRRNSNAAAHDILGFASDELKADTEFMSQVTNHDPRLACFATPG